MKRQRATSGDYFHIQVGSRFSTAGQILELLPQALNSIGIALWEPYESKEFLKPKTQETPLSVLLVTPEQLKRGSWRVTENAIPSVALPNRPYEQYRSTNWVGAKIVGSGIIDEFLKACVGLCPWDDWANPNYLDGMLYPGRQRPAKAVFKNAS